MVHVGGDPDLEQARGSRPNGTTAVDEVFPHAAHLGDVVVGRHERPVGQHEVHGLPGVPFQGVSEIGERHRVGVLVVGIIRMRATRIRLE